MRPGKQEAVEFEYIRHGTQTLIANFEVATGQVISPTIGETHTEQDFVSHIRTTVESDPKGEWIFVTDQLNTLGSLISKNMFKINRLQSSKRAFFAKCQNNTYKNHLFTKNERTEGQYT